MTINKTVKGLSQSTKDLQHLVDKLSKKLPELQISDIIDSKYGLVRIQLTLNKHKQYLFWVGHNEYAIGDKYNSYTGSEKDIIDYIVDNKNKLFNIQKVEESNNSSTILNYKQNIPYSATFIDSAGNQYNEIVTPEEDMNIVQMIQYLKNNFDNFFKLISVIQYVEESIDKYVELRKLLNEEEDILERQIILPTREEFEDFIKRRIQTWEVSKYIKLYRTSKQNSHNEWGTYIYCYDYLDEDGNYVSGYNTYIPYDSDSNFVEKLIEKEMDVIDDIYTKEDIVVQM